MAGKLGVDVGYYNQISSNLHVYINEKWSPEKWLRETETDLMGYPYKTVPIYNPADDEIVRFVEINKEEKSVSQFQRWGSVFLDEVAQPMCHAFHMHKQRDYQAANHWVSKIKSEDWMVVCSRWLNKREQQWLRKQGD